MNKNKKQRRVMLLLILILGITIGFALLSTTLKINGTAGINGNTWNIHWDDTSVNVTTGSVEAEEPEVSTAVSSKDTVSFDVELELPGDFYEFEIDAINEGSVDGALQLSNNWITYKSNGTVTTLPSYMDFKVVYDDNTTPAAGDVLLYGDSKTYKIRVEFKSGVEELPSNPQPITIEVSLPYVQHKEACAAPVSFSTDSWRTISCNAINGNTSAYNIGDTKTIEMDVDEDGVNETYTLRVANKNKSQECNSDNFSQTACGFIVEFVGTLNITNNDDKKMNLNSTNIGGWRDSKMRTYLNTTIYNKLPKDLKRVIKTTKAISGHGGNSGEENFVTQDNLYLLSTIEVGIIPEWDSAADSTRILDYYEARQLATLLKYKYGTTSSAIWWLRTASTYYSDRFYLAGASGNIYGFNYGASSPYEVSPAFRIG